MKHRRIKNLLGAYIDGELKGNLKHIIEEHLRTCPECSEEIQFLKVLHSKIKKEKIPLPADSYWDTFPKRFMEKLEEKKSIGFFSIRVPRIKWELAGGLILILLTFIVSKQIIMEKGGEELSRDLIHKPFISEKSISEEGWIAKDEDDGALPPVATGKPTKKVAEKGKKEKIEAARGAIALPEERREILKKSTPKSAVTKAPGVKIIEDEEKGEAGSVAGLRNEKAGEMNEVQFAAECKQMEEKEGDEVDILADIKAKEDYLRTSKDRVRAQVERRGLLRLLYVQADKSRKKKDIERALKEIEVYRDSYPDEFRDTLIIFSDSLRIIIEEIRKESQSTEETEE